MSKDIQVYEIYQLKTPLIIEIMIDCMKSYRHVVLL